LRLDFARDVLNEKARCAFAGPDDCAAATAIERILVRGQRKASRAFFRAVASETPGRKDRMDLPIVIYAILPDQQVTGRQKDASSECGNTQSREVQIQCLLNQAPPKTRNAFTLSRYLLQAAKYIGNEFFREN
jgi:hypothetical protein